MACVRWWGVAVAVRAAPRSLARRRAAAAGLSVIIHIAIFLFAFSSASGDLVSATGAGGSSGPAFTVTLVRLPPTEPQRSPQGTPLPQLFARLRAGGIGDPIPVQAERPEGDFSALAARIRAQQPAAPPGGAGSNTPSAQARASSQGSALAGEQAASGKEKDAEGEAAGAASTGQLWGAIEPCWRNLGVRGRVPVILEVALTHTGDLRSPPHVIRSASAPIDEPRLQAEAGALAAVAACVPRGNLQLGGKTYRLEFPATP
jgi:hypothetical protein